MAQQRTAVPASAIYIHEKCIAEAASLIDVVQSFQNLYFLLPPPSSFLPSPSSLLLPPSFLLPPPVSLLPLPFSLLPPSPSSFQITQQKAARLEAKTHPKSVNLEAKIHQVGGQIRSKSVPRGLLEGRIPCTAAGVDLRAHFSRNPAIFGAKLGAENDQILTFNNSRCLLVLQSFFKHNLGAIWQRF